MSKESTESASTPRAAAEAYLRGRKVEAAAVFKRPPVRSTEFEFTTDDIRRMLEWIYERLRMGRIGRLQGSFLLAVTANEVFAFKFMERFGTFEVRDQVMASSKSTGQVVHAWLRPPATSISWSEPLGSKTSCESLNGSWTPRA